MFLFAQQQGAVVCLRVLVCGRHSIHQIPSRTEHKKWRAGREQTGWGAGGWFVRFLVVPLGSARVSG